MEIDFKLDMIETLRMKKGVSYRIESLTHPVLPNFLLVKPKLQLPDFVKLEREEDLDLEGTHGCIYTIRAEKAGQGQLISSFEEFRSGRTLLEKTVSLEVV